MTTIERPAAAGTTTRSDARWQADLFETRHPGQMPSARDRVSVRGAFQDALYGRALILDLREDAHREANRDGADALPAELALVVRAGVDLAALAGYRALYLLLDEHAGPVVEPAQFAAFDSGRPRIEVIDGGFAAWRAAGLPVAGRFG